MLHPALLKDSQRDSEKQQQELLHGKFPMKVRTNHEATVSVLKYCSRGLDRTGNLTWRHSDEVGWESILGDS